MSSPVISGCCGRLLLFRFTNLLIRFINSPLPTFSPSVSSFHKAYVSFPTLGFLISMFTWSLLQALIVIHLSAKGFALCLVVDDLYLAIVTHEQRSHHFKSLI